MKPIIHSYDSEKSLNFWRIHDGLQFRVKVLGVETAFAIPNMGLEKTYRPFFGMIMTLENCVRDI